MCKYLGILIITISMCSSSFAQDKVVITVETDIYHYAQQVLAGRKAIEVSSFKHPKCQRDVVDFILAQRAFEMANSPLSIEFVQGNVDGRNLLELVKGVLLVSFDTIWLSAAQPHKEKLYISDPIIRKGEYVAGLYVSLWAKNRIKINKLEDFKRYSVVSSRYWHVDWKTLQQIQPKKLIHEVDWVSMAKLVDKGWVDIMLAPFLATPPFTYQGESYKIQALEGVKLALDDSRHFVISKKHPLSEQAFEIIQSAIKHYRAEGLITRAYQECGFFNKAVKDWKLLKVAH